MGLYCLKKSQDNLERNDFNKPHDKEGHFKMSHYVKQLFFTTLRFLNDEKLTSTKTHRTDEYEISFHRYLRYWEIQTYLNRIHRKYVDLVSLQHYGASYENRNLTLMYISSGANNASDKPIIFADAGIHGREWIAPAQALYIIHQLVEHEENRHLIENVDWIVIPLVNPDGYDYSHNTDRSWRKTRSEGTTNDGVDPNRNFGYKWMGPGSSNKESYATYAGPFPFSEPETWGLSKVIAGYANRTKLYLSFHSSAQSLLYPWGHTDRLPKNQKKLHQLAVDVEKAIEAVNGRRYKIGNSYTTLRPSSGSSRDWAYAVAKIKLSYTVELPPGDAGDGRGYELPPERILEVVKEMFEGIKVFHKYVEDNYSNLKQ